MTKFPDLKSPRTFILFIFFVLVFLTLFFPLFYMLISSYIKLHYFSLFDPKQWSLYFTVFLDHRELILFSRTLILGLGTVFISLILGFSLAFLFERTNMPFKKILKILCFIPLLIPPYIITISWMQMFGNGGYLSKLPIYNMPTVILILSLSYFPIAMFLISAGLKRIGSGLEDAARLISGPKKSFFKITLPLLLPYIISAALFIFVLAVSEFGVPMLLHQNVFVSEIFYQFGAFFDHEKAAAMTFPLITLFFFFILIYGLYLGKKSFKSVKRAINKKQILLSGKLKIFSLSFVFLILSFSFLIPIISLFYVSSVQGFIYAAKTSYYSLFNSLWLSVLGASIITLFSFFIAYLLNHISLIKKRVMETSLILPAIVPSAVVGISLIRTWNTSLTSLVYGSFLIVLLGYLTRFLPFGIKIMSSNFEQLNSSIEESAVLTGSSFSKIAGKIIVPLLMPGILVTWVISFIFCIRELGTTLLVSPAGLETLPIRIYNLVHYASPESVASLCLMLIFSVIIPLALIPLLRKYIVRKNE